MPPFKRTDRDMLLALITLFQEQGFEGTSLSMISEATGLKRASLYHRFPGGKIDMALATMEFAHQQFVDDVLTPLFRDGPLPARIRETIRNLDKFYDGGKRPCLLESLSLGSQTEGRDALAKVVSSAIEGFIEVFAKVAKEAGANRSEARRRAEDAVVRLEGSLVLARGTGNTRPFKRVLKEFPDLLSCIP